MSNHKLLIVEDDPDILEMEKSELERLKYKVFTAQNSNDARKILSNLTQA